MPAMVWLKVFDVNRVSICCGKNGIACYAAALAALPPCLCLTGRDSFQFIIAFDSVDLSGRRRKAVTAATAVLKVCPACFAGGEIIMDGSAGYGVIFTEEMLVYHIFHFGVLSFPVVNSYLLQIVFLGIIIITTSLTIHRTNSCNKTGQKKTFSNGRLSVEIAIT